ncbi:hypothetical protein ACFCYI_19280 [Streptomyces sp. NPDC056257]|uniref:DUF7003 family protein n=1 Tax=Streptomyces sp. NPDC056257 TaxID=3345765 RepID=UPI0035DF09F8
MTTSSILGQFDLCADRGHFPDLLNGYYHPVDVRLHLFGDHARWAVVVELLGYSPRAGNLSDVTYRFGNCLTNGEPGYGEFLDRVDNMAEIVDEDGEGFAGGVPVRVRGIALPVDAAPGTPLEEVFRSLVPAHRGLLLADEAELRTGIPADLPVLLRLDEWYQSEDLREVPPGEQETFRLLAEVLDSGYPARYRPTRSPNTHWSYWPDSGTL